MNFKNKKIKNKTFKNYTLININNYFLSIIILITTLFYSCQKTENDCFKRAGELDSFETNLDDFYRIEINNKLNIYVKKDTINKVKVVGNKNLITSVNINIVDSILILGEDNKCNFTRSYSNEINIIVHTTDLKEIFSFGPVNIYSIDTLDFNRLLVRIYGRVAKTELDVNCDHFFMEQWQSTGETFIGGKTTFFHILNHGNTYIHAFDLDARYVQIEHRSTGDIELSASDKITVDFFDIGNVFYKGEPEIEATNTNSPGKVIKVF